MSACESGDADTGLRLTILTVATTVTSRAYTPRAAIAPIQIQIERHSGGPETGGPQTTGASHWCPEHKEKPNLRAVMETYIHAYKPIRVHLKGVQSVRR